MISVPSDEEVSSDGTALSWLGLLDCPTGVTGVEVVSTSAPQPLKGIPLKREAEWWRRMVSGAQAHLKESSQPVKVPQLRHILPEIQAGFVGVQQVGKTLCLQPVISWAIFAGGCELVDRAVGALLNQGAQYGPASVPFEAVGGASLRQFYSSILSAELCGGLVQLHPPRVHDTSSTAIAAVAHEGDLAGILMAVETTGISDGVVWCFVPPAALQRGARLIVAVSLGELLQGLLQGGNNAVPYFCDPDYRAHGVWVSRWEQHWNRDQAHISVGNAGVGWVMPSDPAAPELPEMSLKGDLIDSDDSDYGEFNSSPFSLDLIGQSTPHPEAYMIVSIQPYTPKHHSQLR